jgi:outer membrane protein assembly factor BamE (lipoprotein component of BamABCDE complex)
MNDLSYKRTLWFLLFSFAVIFLLAACQLPIEQAVPEIPSQDTQIKNEQLVAEPSVALEEIDGELIEPTEPIEPIEPDISANAQNIEPPLRYFQSDEAQYNGIKIPSTSTEELLSLLGEPISTDSYSGGSASYVYNYDDATYYAIEMQHEVNGVMVPHIGINTISVRKNVGAPSPRNIQIGDSFEDVLNKFPQEKNYLSDPGGYFYGSDVWEEPAGYVSNDSEGIEIIVSAGSYDNALKVYFEDGIVTGYLIFWPD